MAAENARLPLISAINWTCLVLQVVSDTTSPEGEAKDGKQTEELTIDECKENIRKAEVSCHISHDFISLSL